MRALTFAALLTLAADGSSPAGEVTFKKKPPQVGEVETATGKFIINFTINLRLEGKPLQTSRSKHVKEIKTEEEVLAVKDGATSKFKVKYLVASETETSDAAEDKKTAKPHEGKTYIVKLGPDGPAVTCENGKAPPEKELAAVKEDYGSRGTTGSLKGFLSGKTLVLDRTVDCPPEISRQLLGDKEDSSLKVRKFSFTLKGTRKVNGEDCAVLRTLLVISGKSSDGSVGKLVLKGETLVLPDCRLAGMALSGNFTVKGSNPATGVKMDASGTMEMSMSEELRPPAPKKPE